MLAFDILFCSSASMWPSLAIILLSYVNSCTGFSMVSSTLMSSSMVVVEFGRNITSVLVCWSWWCIGNHINNPLDFSSAAWAISALLSEKKQFSHKYICGFCKEVCILAWLDVDSVHHVSESLFKHCWQKDRENCGSQYAPLLDPVCCRKCIRDLPSIPDVHYHSGMQTFYHATVQSSQRCQMPSWSRQRQYTEVDPALCTFPGVARGRSCIRCFGLKESCTASLAPPLG